MLGLINLVTKKWAFSYYTLINKAHNDFYMDFRELLPVKLDESKN